MAFCKYCGAKLEDGQECTCEEALAAAKAKEEAEAESVKAENAEEITREAPAESDGENADTESSEDKETAPDGEEKSVEGAKEPPTPVVISPPVPAQNMSEKMLRRGLILVCALALGLVLFIVVVGNVAGNGYKRPVRNVVRGLNRERAELVINSFYPRDYVEELRDNAEDGEMEWRDVTDDMDSLISDVKEVCEDSYFGDDLKVSAKIVKKKKATAKDLRTLKKEFENYDAVVKKAYRLKVLLTVKGDDEKEQVHFYIYSVKLKGGRWVLYADDKTKGALSSKTEDIYKEMDKELAEIFSDYSRSLNIVIPKD